MRDKPIATRSRNGYMHQVDFFLSSGPLYGITELSKEGLFLRGDFGKLETQKPEIFSDFEIKQINDHLKDVPLQIARLTFIQQSTGTRVSDLLTTPIKYGSNLCVRKVKGGYVFTYNIQKEKSVNTIPVDDNTALTLFAIIQDDIDRFGDDAQYLFSISKDEPRSVASYSTTMNRMFDKYHICSETGEPTRFKSHTFRRTKASEYANLGISPDVIAMLLGQKGLWSLSHYITITSAAMHKAMTPIMEQDGYLISHIGNIPDKATETDIPERCTLLPEGYCASETACDHGNACIENRCPAFHPLKSALPQLNRMLQEAERNAGMAKLNGYDRYYELNERLAASLRYYIEQLSS